MKILIIKDAPGEIKAHRMTYNIQELGLAVAFRKMGHECDVMSVSDHNRFSRETVCLDGQDVTIYSAKAFTALKNGWLRGVSEILDRYDILQVSEYNQIYTWHIARKYRHKMVCYHGPYYCGFNHNYNRMAKVFDLFFLGRYRKLNTCFVTKSGLAKDYLEAKGLRNVHAVGVGLNTTFLQDDTAEELPELAPMAKMDCLKLLYVGVIEPRRNSLFLLDILGELKKRGVDFKLIMIGRYKDDAYKQEFEEKVDALGLTHYIYYVPRVEQKHLGQVYAKADIFLLPTIYDIYGMVLLEAMYFGIPTITSVNGGSDMMMRDGENGYVIPDFDAHIWASKIMELSNDKACREKIGEAARATILQGFTWEKLAPKFIDIYTKCKKENRR